ncbi:MAG: hypothetical protein QW390_04515 [Candidatus Bathyarchaeia archaeon]
MKGKADLNAPASNIPVSPLSNTPICTESNKPQGSVKWKGPSVKGHLRRTKGEATSAESKPQPLLLPKVAEKLT